jgi:hypothetical protein
MTGLEIIYLLVVNLYSYFSSIVKHFVVLQTSSYVMVE